MLFKTQDIDGKEDAQPTVPTTMEQAALFPKALQALFKTDHDGSESSNFDLLSSGLTDNKDRTDALVNMDHLPHATATSLVRDHGRVGRSVGTPPS